MKRRLRSTQAPSTPDRRRAIAPRRLTLALARSAVGALCLVSANAALAQPFVEGDEFRVNAATQGSQRSPDVLASSDGSFIVVWGGDGGVWGQRFAADGQRVGGGFQVSNADRGWYPAMAANDNGNLVVVWSEASDYPNSRLLGRRLRQTGEREGSEFVVAMSEYWSHDVAMAPDGGYVVTWSDYYGEVFLQAYDPSGEVLAEQVPVNEQGAHGYGPPAIAMAASGESIVVWHDWDHARIVGQRFGRGGERIGASFMISTDPNWHAWSPDVAMAPDGAFVVVWTEDQRVEDVVGQRFDARGKPVGALLRVFQDNAGKQREPSVAIGRSGDFFVIWATQGEDESEEGVFGQLFNPSAVPIGSAFPINVRQVDATSDPAVAMADDGALLAAWEAPSSARAGADRDVFGRRLPSATADRDADGVADAHDNCPTVANQDQADAQGDGYGDACVSPDVVLPSDLRLGSNPVLGAGTKLATGVVIGNDAVIGEQVLFGQSVRAGTRLRIADLALIGRRAVLGDDVVIGLGSVIDAAVRLGDRVRLDQQVTIRRGAVLEAGVTIEAFAVVDAAARIGAGATVETGAKVGRRARVRPGAVVPAGTSVPPNASYP